jgi:hypothetical protein
MDAPLKEYPNKTDEPAMLKFYEATMVEFAKHWIMKAKNAISPFEAVPVRFTFLHSSPSSLVNLYHNQFTI